MRTPAPPGRRSPVAGSATAPSREPTNRDDNEEAFDTHPDCHEGFAAGSPTSRRSTSSTPGATRDMEFTLGGNQGLDILASDSPYSRQVDCNTLKTVDPSSPFITPRPIPVPAESPGNSGLTYDAAEDVYTFPWKTLKEWDGSCREFVLTRKDGVQHRAYFRFGDRAVVPGLRARSRRERCSRSPARPSRSHGTQSPLTTTTDANGFYSFASVSRGTYTATASASGCHRHRRRQPGRRAGADDGRLHAAGEVRLVRLLVPARGRPRSPRRAQRPRR